MSDKRNPLCVFALLRETFIAGALLAWLPVLRAEPYPRAFFKDNCIRCHGPEKSKGKVTLHDLEPGEKLETWERVLEALEHGEMPPEDEPQPEETERKAVVRWVESSLKEAIANSEKPKPAALARRLTNFEYENTIRDLIGFRIKLVDNLPKDPLKPYHFNNTAEFMLIGPEQIDRYLENARRVMASAIVDPEKPVVHKKRQEWQPHGLDRGMGADEIGLWGNRRHSPSDGMGVKDFPERGEFVIRVQASAILPPGIKSLPLSLIMGQSININSSTQQVERVGTVTLDNSPDNPEVFEFRGRVENFPVSRGRVNKGKRQPDTLHITPQVLYDDGTLNDGGYYAGQRGLTMPRAVINWMEFEAPVVEVWPPEHHTRILFESPLRDSDPTTYVREVIRRFASRAFRRPATDEEVGRFEKIYQLVLPELKTLEAALRETLAMVLVSPQFMYHTVADGGVFPKDYELASKLSYFLWGTMPDDGLLLLAADKQLSAPEVIEAQVRRLLSDPRAQDFAKNFTMQWLSLAKMKTVPINQQLYPRFLYYVPRGERAGTEEPYRPTIRDYMLEESVGYFAELVRRNAPVSNIVESDFACLNQPLAVHYGIKGVEGNEIRPVNLKPEDKLGGFLTQGSVLIGNGTGSAPHPIYRAVWLREAILGDEVSAPPAEVPALVDSAGASAEKALTIKDLLALHRNKESCNDCHVRLDPWGIPFEHYNAIGKYQPKVPKEGSRVSGFNSQEHGDLEGYAKYLESLNTEQIEASSRLPYGPEVNGMEDLKSHLIQEHLDDIAKNLLKRLLTYGIGRQLQTTDRFAIETIFRESAKTGHRIQDMVVLACKSDLFLNHE